MLVLETYIPLYLSANELVALTFNRYVMQARLRIHIYFVYICMYVYVCVCVCVCVCVFEYYLVEPLKIWGKSHPP